MRLLFLVIANDYYPFQFLQKWNWERFIKVNPNVDVFFLKEDEHLVDEYRILDHNFYYKIKPHYYISIFIKTIAALNYLNFSNYDFVIRTNLSSMLMYDRITNYLQQYLDNNTADDLYAGAKLEHSGVQFCSGAFFIMGKNVSKFLLDNYRMFPIGRSADDVVIGEIITKKFSITDLVDNRVIINSIENLDQQISSIDKNCLQVRVTTHNSPNRNNEEIIHTKLYKHFYPDIFSS